MPVKSPLDRRDFEIALICALPLEAECVQAMSDFKAGKLVDLRSVLSELEKDSENGQKK